MKRQASLHNLNGKMMNNINNELFPIGNGRFYALIKELSVKEIYATHGNLSFCSFEYQKEDNESSFTKSQRIFNSSRWHTRVLELINPGTNEEFLHYCSETDDTVIPENDLFIRRIKNKEPMFFKLKIPSYARLVKAPDVIYSSYKATAYFIKISYGNYEEILQLSFSGDCRFNPYDMTFSAGTGESIIIFAVGTIPANVHRNSARVFRLYQEEKIPEGALLFKEEKWDNIRNAVFALTIHTMNQRGIVAGSNDPYLRMFPVYASVKLFNSIGIKKFAKALCINSLNRFLSVSDCVGVGPKKELQFSTDIFSVVPSLLWLCAFETPDEAFLKSMLPFMLARCKIQAKSLISGMLTFEGREYYYNNFCPVTDGSAISTLLFIKSTELLCRYSEDKEIQTALLAARDSYRNNFIKDSKIYLNSHKRSFHARFPKFIYGVCSFCENKEFKWLTKNSANSYCCDDCMDIYKSKAAPNINFEKESYLPALWAVYIESDMFTPEEIRYSQDLALNNLDNIHINDLALLLYSMSKFPHKAQRQIYDLIISKQNSLGIWYDRNGNFDTFSNALCALAVSKAKKL